VEVQEVRWEDSVTEPDGEYSFSTERVMSIALITSDEMHESSTLYKAA
jgi:hypothetical protein